MMDKASAGDGLAFSNAVVLWDVFESYKNGRQQIPPLKTRNALSLSHVLRHALRFGPNLNCETLSWEKVEHLRATGYTTCLGDTARGLSYAEWVDIYAAQPSPELVALCADYFADQLIIGFHLPPVLCAALHAANLAWLQLTVYPARFLDDLPLGFACQNKNVMDFVNAQRLTEERISLGAARLAARYAPDHISPGNWLYPHSLLILAPTYYDNPLPDTDGEQRTLLEQEYTLRSLAGEYAHVYACQNLTGDFVPEEYELLRNGLGATFIEQPHFRAKIAENLPESLYLYASHPSIDCAAGLPSALLTETAWFGKRTVSLACHTDDDEKEPGELPSATPLDERCLSPAFWSGVVQSFMGANVEQSVPLPSERLNLRRLFKGAGCDFDDSQSISLLNNAIAARSMAAEAQFGVSWLADGLAKAYSTPLPPLVRRERKFPFAIFAAGDENIVPQAIVALRSFGVHLGNENLFYLAGDGEISEATQKLLSSHGIRLLVSDLHHGFSASYRGSPPVAYLQLAGYKLLSEQGFDWSMGVQPDVLCLRDFDSDEVFQKTDYIAAPLNYLWRISYSLRSSTQGISWLSDWTGLDDPGFIPALLFCNHAGLRKINMLGKAKDAFDESGPENLFLNEEAVLHRLQYDNRAFCRRLPDSCAYLLSYNDHVVRKPWAIHYDYQAKPWKKPAPIWTAHEEVLYRVWYRAARQLLDTITYTSFIKKYENFYSKYCGISDKL